MPETKQPLEHPWRPILLRLTLFALLFVTATSGEVFQRSFGVVDGSVACAFTAVARATSFKIEHFQRILSQCAATC